MRFLFGVTLDRHDLARRLVITRHPRKLPEVLSVEEVGRLLEAAPGIKYRAALGVVYGAGLRVSEVALLKVDDIDSKRMLIRVEQGKLRLRLLGIDAPEMGKCPRQRVCAAGSGSASKAALAITVRGRVTYRPIKLDRYGRTIAVVYANGTNLSCSRLNRGQAIYRREWDDGRIVGRESR